MLLMVVVMDDGDGEDGVSYDGGDGGGNVIQ